MGRVRVKALGFEEDIEAALGEVSSLWGGVSAPIFSVGDSERNSFELSLAGAMFEIDALKAEKAAEAAEKAAAAAARAAPKAAVARAAAVPEAPPEKEVLLLDVEEAEALAALGRELRVIWQLVPPLVREAAKASDIKALVSTLDLALKDWERVLELLQGVKV